MWNPTIDDIEEYKNINEEQSSNHDKYYMTMLPLLLDYVEEYCNHRFPKDSNGKPNLPGGVKIFLAKSIQHNMTKAGIKSRSMGSVSYSYDLEFSDSLLKYLRPYKKVRFRSLQKR